MATYKPKRLTFTQAGVINSSGAVIFQPQETDRVLVIHCAVTTKGQAATYRLFFGDDPEDGEQNFMERNLGVNESAQIDVDPEYELSGHANEPVRIVGGTQNSVVSVELWYLEIAGEF